MNDMELDKRKARAANETLVIAPTEGGFRVYNPANITHIYMVSGIPEAPKCNCPDFQTHELDADWRCKHILAVMNQLEKQAGKSTTKIAETPGQQGSESKSTESVEKRRIKTSRSGSHTQMLIKRSISPDGRIDSVSVEFSTPIDEDADEVIVEHANKILSLQSVIANGFLQTYGKPKPHAHDHTTGNGRVRENGHDHSNGEANNSGEQRANGSSGNADTAVPAQLLNIAGMETRGGWKTFINVQVNGITAKLFGDKQELAKHITDAGFASVADHITQGMLLNLPCRVTRQWSRDGKYLNIEKVLPPKPLDTNGRAGQ